MRAIRVEAFGGPEQLTLADVPVPGPGPGQVRVRLHAAGVNPVDTYIRAGTYARTPPLPFTPGTDGAGVIAAGAAVGVPCITAYRALFQCAGLKPGERVLIHGASGGVGTAAVQMARAHGARVAGTAGTEAGLELVRSEGAHLAADHTAPGYLDQLAAFAGGFDVVVEMLANVNLERDLHLLAMRGRVVVVGNRGTLEFNPRSAMAREATIIGTTLWNAAPEELASAHAWVGAALEGGVLRPVVGRELPLADAAQAHAQVMAPGAHGKIVLVS